MMPQIKKLITGTKSEKKKCLKTINAEKIRWLWKECKAFQFVRMVSNFKLALCILKLDSQEYLALFSPPFTLPLSFSAFRCILTNSVLSLGL